MKKKINKMLHKKRKHILVMSIIVITIFVISLRVYGEYLKISTIAAEFSASMNIMFVDTENVSMAVSSRYQELNNSKCHPYGLGSDYLVNKREKGRDYECMLSSLDFINKKILESHQLELDPARLYFYSPKLGLLYFFSKQQELKFEIEELDLLKNSGVYKKTIAEYYKRLLSTDEKSDGNSSTEIYIDRATNQKAYTLTSFVYGENKNNPVGFLYYDHTKDELKKIFQLKTNEKSMSWVSAYIISKKNGKDICITNTCSKSLINAREEYSNQYSVVVYLDVIKFAQDKINILIVIFLIIATLILYIVTTRKVANNHLKSMLDPLTGAYTRKSMKYIDISQSSFFILLDLNKFKQINDNYGHIVGDKALLTVSNLIKDNLRKTDMVIRLGGDEFLVHIKNADYILTFKIAERIANDVMLCLFQHEGIKITLSVSFGISKFEGTIEESINKADERMYDQKKEKYNAHS